MPMHDWTRVPDGIYHDFHDGWLYAIRGALNSGLLPKGYYALAEHTTPPYVPDVLTLTQPADEQASNGAGLTTGEGSVATLAPPVTRVAGTEEGKNRKSVGRRRVAVRHVQNRQLVAVIEIVAPSN